MRTITRGFGILTLGMAVAACGGSKVPPSDDPGLDAPADPTSATEEPAAPLGWSEMSQDQKTEHMQTAVMPKMGEVFSAFDAERYAKITCVTCHGAGAKKGEFAMPSPDLPKLPPNGQFEELMESKADVMKFMIEKVGPEMAGTLPGVEPYNPETHEGLGCYNCHQSE